MITGVRQAITRMSLDMHLPDVQKSFSCTKGDVNRRLEITLTDGGRPFELPNKWTVILSGRKPDETTLNNGCVVERGKIIYDFASGAEIATCPGVFQINFQIYDETGLPVATPAIWVQVTEGTRDAASNDQFTALEDLIRKINEAKEDIETLEDLMNVGGPLAATVGAVIIKEAEWKDGEAVITLPGIGKNTTTLLIPADEKTRLAATESALYVNADRIDEETIVLAKAAASDAVEMSFVYVIVRGRGVESGEQESEIPPAVSIVGVGGGASSESLIYVGDGTMPEDCIMQIIPDEDDEILDDTEPDVPDTPEDPEPEEPETPDDPDEPVTHTLTINGAVYLENGLITGASFADGASLSTKLFPFSGYQLISVTVTMGGEEVVGAYNAASSELKVDNIKGDVVITAETQFLTVFVAFSPQNGFEIYRDNELVSGNITAAKGSTVTVSLKALMGYLIDTVQPSYASGGVIADAYDEVTQTLTLTLTESVTVVINAVEIDTDWTVTLDAGEGIDMSNNATALDDGDSYSNTITATEEGLAPLVKVYKDGEDISSEVYSADNETFTGSVNIPSVDGHIRVIAEAVEPYTLSLSGAVILMNGMQNGSKLAHGSAIVTELGLSGGTLKSITVSIGGALQDNVYDAESNTLTIPYVTGNVIITAEIEF